MINPCLSCHSEELSSKDGLPGSVSFISCSSCGMAIYSGSESLDEITKRWNKISPVGQLRKASDDIVAMARKYRNVHKKEALLDASSVIIGQINSIKK